MQGFPFPIITYQVITGNYSGWCRVPLCFFIITYQVITGNYSRVTTSIGTPVDYNIPSNNRELQHDGIQAGSSTHYNIPSNNRELQLQCIMGIQ